MATPKKPADHQPKATDQYDVDVDGKKWTVAKAALDDFELLDDLGEIESGNGARMPSALKRLLGREQYRDALEHLRDPKTGVVGVEAGSDFVRAIFEGLPQGNR